MLIVCPSCASTYTIDAERLGPAGRRVRCAACRGEWFVTPETPPSAPPDSGHEGRDAASGKELAIAASAQSQHSGRSVEPSRSGRPRHRRPRFARFARAVTAPLRRAPGFAATLGLCLGLMGAVLGREAIVRHWPEAARLYAAAGLPVNTRGLAFEAVRSELTTEAGAPILVVEGEIRNLTGTTRDVPSITLGVRRAAGQALYAWTVDPSRPAIEAGGTLAFRTRLAAPPAEGHDVIVRFAEPERLAAARETR